MTKSTPTRPAGYVPGAKDADGSEDPVPTEVLQTTEAAGAGKPKLDPGKQILPDGPEQDDENSKP